MGIIAPPFVFKIKEPVDLGFVDFSTLGKRRHFCERELELNRRLCPEVYLDAVAIWIDRYDAVIVSCPEYKHESISATRSPLNVSAFSRMRSTLSAPISGS
jgi:aminoglycoside phosphotransferase family enzyme